MTPQIQAIETMANLTFCQFYRTIPIETLIDSILTTCRITLMMYDIRGFILFNPTNNNFYFRNYDTTNKPN